MPASGLGRLGVACALFAGLAAAQETGWTTDFAAAVKKAKSEQKVVLADFTGTDWCHFCIKLKQEVFDTPEFKAWAAKKAVLVEVDSPKKKKLPEALKARNEALKARFEIKAYPTIIFVDGDDRELGRVKYVKGGPSEWIKQAERAIKPKVAEVAWPDDLDAALLQAKLEKKLVLASFTRSDWCPWSLRLKDEIFATPEFKAWAAKNVVLLEVDFPRGKAQTDRLRKQNKELRDLHGVKGYPTLLFLDADGRKVGETGYAPGGVEAWIKAADLARARS